MSVGFIDSLMVDCYSVSTPDMRVLNEPSAPLPPRRRPTTSAGWLAILGSFRRPRGARTEQRVRRGWCKLWAIRRLPSRREGCG